MGGKDITENWKGVERGKRLLEKSRRNKKKGTAANISKKIYIASDTAPMHGETAPSNPGKKEPRQAWDPN